MIGWIVSCSVLIAIVLAARCVLRGKISLRLGYALWLIVLIRLLVPFSPVQSRASVLNLLPREEKKEAPVSVILPIGESHSVNVPTAESKAAVSALEISALEQNENTKQKTMKKAVSPIPIIWAAGAAVTAGVIAFSNLRFRRKLESSRVSAEGIASPLPVFVSNEAGTPCLVGLFRPKIYLTPGILEDETALSHVLAHETTHFRHGDHVWALLRTLCVVIHWYNPLVWAAAVFSKRDCELACDEGTIARLGEEARAEYGRTLIGLTCDDPRGKLLNLSTAMGGGIKERIKLIARKPKNIGIAVAVLVLIIAAAVVLTFTRAKKPEKTAGKQDDAPSVSLTELEGYKEYAFDEVLYIMPMLSYYPANGTGQQYFISRNGLVIVDQYTGEIVSAASALRDSEREVDNAYWHERIPIYPGGDPVELLEGYASVTECALTEWYAIYFADNEVWLAINGDDGTILHLYRLKECAENVASVGGADESKFTVTRPTETVKWEFKPYLSSRYPAFCFEFDAIYTSIRASCTEGTLISYDTHMPDGYPTGTELEFTAGSSIYWSPATPYASGTEISFTLLDGEKELCSGEFEITKDENENTVGGTVYSARLLNCAELVLFQHPEQFGAYLVPKTLGTGSVDYASVSAADIPGFIAVLPRFDWNYYVLTFGENLELTSALYEYVSDNSLTEEQCYGVMCGTHGLDGVYSEGYAGILKTAKQKDPELFGRCYEKLPAIQQGIIDAFLDYAG